MPPSTTCKLHATISGELPADYLQAIGQIVGRTPHAVKNAIQRDEELAGELGKAKAAGTTGRAAAAKKAGKEKLVAEKAAQRAALKATKKAAKEKAAAEKATPNNVCQGCCHATHLQCSSQTVLPLLMLLLLHSSCQDGLINCRSPNFSRHQV